MKKVFSLILVLCMVLSCVSIEAQMVSQMHDISYEERDGKTYLTKYVGYEEEEYTVDASVSIITKGAFTDCENLKRLIIPDTVELIENGAFVNCHNLEKVVIGKGIKTIGVETFKYCGIKKLVILNPETKLWAEGDYSVYTHGRELNYWQPGSFSSCAIGEINAPSGSPAEEYAKVKNIKFVPFEASSDDFEYEIKDNEVTITKYKGDSYNVVIPEEIEGLKVATIGRWAFLNNNTIRKVVLPQSMKVIGDEAFERCVNLEEINLEWVESLCKGAFLDCVSLKKVSLLNLKSWYGISDDRIDTEKGIVHKIKYLPPQIIGQYEVDSLYTPFMGCTGLEEVTIKWPEKVNEEKLDALFLNCPNIKKVTFENFTNEPSVIEFYNIVYSTSPKAHLEMYAKIKTRTPVAIYAYDEKAKEYADKYGIKCELLKKAEIEVEPKIQSIHGGIVLKNGFVEHITEIAEANGGMVVTSGENISVQKNGKNLAIIGSDVYYTQNGTMVKESLYYNHNFLKMPEKALENVLGADGRKSEKYKKALSAYSGQIHRIAGTVETPYGSVAEYYTGGVMHSVANELVFIKWNGETINITNDAPYYNSWCHGRWSKIELSEDGKILTVTYPENDKKLEFHNSEIPTILWDEGTYIITVNLETGEVTRVIEPLEKEEEKAEVPKEEKPAEEKGYQKDGITVTTSILEEPQNGPEKLFDGDYISYCVITTRDETKPEYIQFDLGEVKKVEKLGLAFRMGDMRTTYFDIRVSRDGVNFETVIPKRGCDPNNDMQYFDINKKARYIRMYGYSNTQNKYWVSITEADVIAK